MQEHTVSHTDSSTWGLGELFSVLETDPIERADKRGDWRAAGCSFSGEHPLTPQSFKFKDQDNCRR